MKLLRVTGPDFCVGALFDNEDVCVRVGDKLTALKGMYIEKAMRRCQFEGFTVEVIPAPDRPATEWQRAHLYPK